MAVKIPRRSIQAHKAWFYFNDSIDRWINSIDIYWQWGFKSKALALNVSAKGSADGTFSIRLAIPWLITLTFFLNCGRLWATRWLTPYRQLRYGFEIDVHGGQVNWGGESRRWGWVWRTLYVSYIERLIIDDEILNITTRAAIPYYQSGYNTDEMLLKITTFRRTRRFYWGIWWSRRSLYHKVEVLKCDTKNYIDCLIVRCGRTADGAVVTYLHALYLHRAR